MNFFQNIHACMHASNSVNHSNRSYPFILLKIAVNLTPPFLVTFLASSEETLSFGTTGSSFYEKQQNVAFPGIMPGNQAFMNLTFQLNKTNTQMWLNKPLL